ncbi:MAG: CHAP domain-containing protein [Acidimicrobiales bacterium]
MRNLTGRGPGVTGFVASATRRRRRPARRAGRGRSLACAAVIALTASPGAHLTARSGAAPVPAGACTSSAYACTIDGYSALTMNDNWATQYYGPGAVNLGSPPHNCTLFAAWMLARHGLADPGRTWGNAGQWGYTLARYTNHTPRVGAIAWYAPWRLANSDGHVAYVERVDAHTGSVFLVSDNWGGAEHGSTTSGWTAAAAPSGYIHLRDVTHAPTVPRRPPTTTTTLHAPPTTVDPSPGLDPSRLSARG